MCSLSISNLSSRQSKTLKPNYKMVGGISFGWYQFWFVDFIRFLLTCWNKFHRNQTVVFFFKSVTMGVLHNHNSERTRSLCFKDTSFPKANHGQTYT